MDSQANRLKIFRLIMGGYYFFKSRKIKTAQLCGRRAMVGSENAKIRHPLSLANQLKISDINKNKLFIPSRDLRTYSPDGVHLKVFPIYIALVNENWGFKNTTVDRPFSNRRKTLSPEGKSGANPMGST